MTAGFGSRAALVALPVLAALLACFLIGCAAGGDRSGSRGVEPPGHAHLVLLLASECRLDDRADALVLPDGSRFSPPLAFAFELRPMIPDLAKRERSGLSEDEVRLANYVLLITESDSDTAAALRSAPSWPCVVEAREAPRVSPP